jgi:hypothetical protein
MPSADDTFTEFKAARIGASQLDLRFHRRSESLHDQWLRRHGIIRWVLDCGVCDTALLVTRWKILIRWDYKLNSGKNFW